MLRTATEASKFGKKRKKAGMYTQGKYFGV